MRIRDLLEDAAPNMALKLGAAVNQVASRFIETGADTPMSLSALLDILNKVGINISEKQFREIVDNEPLKNIIASVEGDKVTFIGQRKDTSGSVKPDQTTRTLEKMAQRATKNRQ
jgi:hypothetical protein